MQIEIKLKDGRVKRLSLEAGAAVSTDQLRIMVKWAVEGRPAEVMQDY